MIGYYDACRDGKLKEGAHDFNAIHQFFREANLTMVGLKPADACVGGDSMRSKCARPEEIWIGYLAIPGGDDPEIDGAAESVAKVSVALSEGTFSARWYYPIDGTWSEPQPVDSHTFKAPGPGDFILLLQRTQS